MALHVIRNRQPTEDCFEVHAEELPSEWNPSWDRPPVRNAAPSPVGTPLTQPCPHHALLVEVLSTHRNLLRHVPKGALGVWGMALAGAIQKLLSQKTWEAFTALMAFPKVTLATPHRGGKKNAFETARLVRRSTSLFTEGNWLQAWRTNTTVDGRTRSGKKPRKEPSANVAQRVNDESIL